MQVGTRIGVLSGGLSSERELSLRTGEAVHAALTARGHDAVRIFVDRDLDLALRAERIDVAFLALHGRYGEDGCVQGLLELRAIPYTGSGVLASALAMDKVKAKELFRLHNIPTPPYYLRRAGSGPVIARHAGFGWPVVVKPRGEGSSLGLRRADDPEELEAAVEEAARFGDEILIERFIGGVEVHVVVLGGRALGAIEVTRERPYDFASRRESRIIPPRLPPERLRGILTLGERAATALDCEGLVEVDLIVSPSDNEYVIEVDTQPFLGPHGRAEEVARAAGMDLGALCELLLDGALVRAGESVSGEARAEGAAHTGHH